MYDFFDIHRCIEHRLQASRVTPTPKDRNDASDCNAGICHIIHTNLARNEGENKVKFPKYAAPRLL